MDEERPITPYPPRSFVSGPSIRPTAQLLEWLNRIQPDVPKRKRQVKLPVVVRFDSKYSLGIVEAFIGATEAVDNETIFLRLDDSAMGISLMDRLRQRCPPANKVCVVWLEGYWGSRFATDPLEVLEPKGKPKRWPFAVVKLHELIEGMTSETDVRAQIESLSP